MVPEIAFFLSDKAWVNSCGLPFFGIRRYTPPPLYIVTFAELLPISSKKNNHLFQPFTAMGQQENQNAAPSVRQREKGLERGTGGIQTAATRGGPVFNPPCGRTAGYVAGDAGQR